MSDWEAITDEAERLAQQFRQRGIDLAEAENVVDYYVLKAYDDGAVARYLRLMATAPPPRSRRSQSHFRNLLAVWEAWHPNLPNRDKARAWGWGVRAAKTQSSGR